MLNRIAGDTLAEQGLPKIFWTLILPGAKQTRSLRYLSVSVSASALSWHRLGMSIPSLQVKKIPRQRCNLWVACLLNQSSYLLLQNKFVLELKHTSSYSFMLICHWLTVANVVQRATWFEFWYIKIHFLPLPWELSLSYCIRNSDGSSTKANSSLLLPLLLQLCFYSQLVLFG